MKESAHLTWEGAQNRDNPYGIMKLADVETGLLKQEV